MTAKNVIASTPSTASRHCAMFVRFFAALDAHDGADDVDGEADVALGAFARQHFDGLLLLNF